MYRFTEVFLLVLFFVAGFPGISHAYIDPGSGIILLQVMSALFVGVIFSIRSAIADFIRKIFKKDSKESED